MSRNDRSPRSARASAGLVPNDENASDSSTVARRDTQSAVSVYRSRGWCPLPLREGTKFPPVDDTTGNKPYPDVPVVWAEFAEDHDAARANLANRMPAFTDEDTGEEFEVIGIDVDEYDEKHGAETLAALIAEHGELPPTFSSTSRGADSPSRILFYVVPAGMKWAGKPGPDIEIIQRTHRYAVAWPSVVEGREYRWYDPQGRACDVPDVATFPDLPDSWVEYLRKGKAEAPRADVEEFDDLAEALGWLEENIPGYDAPMSGQMDRQTDPDKLAEEATGGAHDAMLARVHEVVRLAAEGHHGLKAALDRIESAFAAEVLGDRRDMLTARLEWNRALCGEVSDLADDVENDRVRISKVGGYTAGDAEIDIEGWHAKMITQLADRIEPVDATQFDPNDTGAGYLFIAAYGDNVRPVLDSEDWVYWDVRAGALRRLTPEQINGELWDRAVPTACRGTADDLDAKAQVAEDSGEGDPDELRKQAAAMRQLAVKMGFRAMITNGLKQAHSRHPNPVDPAEFDGDGLLLGVADGVVDFGEAVPNADGEIGDPYARKGTPEDLALTSTQVPYVHGYTHPRWESYLDTFLSDPDYRRYVRKVLGYAALCAHNPLRKMIFLHGGTSTGKSTMVEAMQAAVGEYAATVDMNAMFRQKRDGGPNPEMLAAFPRRVIFASEVGQRNRLHSDMIKRLTGGDSITTRALYSNKMVQRVPRFTPVIATNSMPTVEDADEAFDGRLLVLPFTHRAAPLKANEGPLCADPDVLPAVLAWLVAGYADYLAEGIADDYSDAPDVVRKARRRALSDVNDFRRFFTDNLRETSTKVTTATSPKHYPVTEAVLVDEYAKATDVRKEQARREIRAQMDKYRPAYRDRPYHRATGVKAKNPCQCYRGVSWKTQVRIVAE
ncbi:phage/plasmid primase, P4 family [Gordonia jacobaea]|uniref:phage/plasmid primase, P4 family n=1 Tax=Gordonia jacobaea TaxID=122202 RepID=UPI0022E63E1E|nr:phage/plasmid primase, P4 family [Gordonia jacobaea]